MGEAVDFPTFSQFFVFVNIKKNILKVAQVIFDNTLTYPLAIFI